MHRLKSIRLYFFSILKLSLLSLRNYYLKSNYYNKKLLTFVPLRIFYEPSSYLGASLINNVGDFYKISNSSPNLLWKINIKDKQNFNNLHSFLWLTKIDRKNSKVYIKDIIKSWIKNFNNYDPNTWKMEITSKRIISWVSNTDITLQDSDKFYKEEFFRSIIKQSNFLLKNLNNLSLGSTKIICCSAIILSGIIFKENEFNFKNGFKELEKIINNFFDNSGFPKTRNPEDVFISLKYFILIREWLKESQKTIPEFLDKIILKCGSCYIFLSSMNKQFPLFNGATEINHKEYDSFLKNQKYKFDNSNNNVADFIKIKKKKLDFIIDCGNPPTNNFSKNYQAGCLSFELNSNKQKIICNSGYAKYLNSKLSHLSRSTAAHSTLYLNDTSSCIFRKNNTINKVYGVSLLERLKIVEKNYTESKDFYHLSASHNGYENKFGYMHSRSIKISKKEDKIFALDQLKKTKNYSNSIVFSVRFHIYPDNKIAKTKSGNSVLISLSNGEGWLLTSNSYHFKIESNIFFGNKKKIINNESALISGIVDKPELEIGWSIERVT